MTFNRQASSADAPLRIAFYSPNLPDSGASNGIVTYSRILRDALRRLGHAVTIVTPDQVEHADGSIADLAAPNRVAAHLRHLFEARRQDGSDPWVRMRVLQAFEAARNAGVDVFEIEESFGWAGRLVGHGVSIVERLHGPHAFVADEIDPAREAAEVASLRKVQAVTAPTSRLLTALAERYGLDLPLTRVVPNPMSIPAERWRIDAANRDQLLFVGRFDRCKGADVVLRAFARALQRRPSLELVVVGPDRGLRDAGGKLVHFNEYVSREIPPQARERIRFIKEQPAQRIAELRLQSGLAIVGSRFENFAYSIAEAMAAGSPVLTTETFGGCEMIRDGLDGCVVPIGEVEPMADAIIEMVADPSRLSRVGESARTRVAEWLSPERIARETVSVYREALARG